MSSPFHRGNWLGSCLILKARKLLECEASIEVWGDQREEEQKVLSLISVSIFEITPSTIIKQSKNSPILKHVSLTQKQSEYAYG